MKRSSALLMVAVAFMGSGRASADGGIAQCAAASEEAQRLRNANHLREASDQLLICADPKCPDAIRRACSRWAEDNDQAIPHLSVRAVDARKRDVAGVRVFVDGEPRAEKLDGAPILVDPGMHAIRLEATSGDVVERTIVLSREERRRLTVDFPTSLRTDGTRDDLAPPPTRQPAAAETPVLGYVLGGVGIAALGTFGVFEAMWRNRYSDLQDGCGQTRTCSDRDVGQVRTELYVARTALGIGVIALGVAAWQILSVQRKAGDAR